MGWPKINQIDQLGLSEKAKRIFAWKFFAGESFADWPGAENRKELYEVYQKVFNGYPRSKERNVTVLNGIDYQHIRQ